jgi:uncharacterized protein YneF (UPF0154 family)
MLEVTLTIGTLVSILFFCIGGVIGWLARENVMSKQMNYHPEMFDDNGNLIPDQIIAFRFENGEELCDYDDED